MNTDKDESSVSATYLKIGGGIAAAIGLIWLFKDRSYVIDDGCHGIPYMITIPVPCYFVQTCWTLADI